MIVFKNPKVSSSSKDTNLRILVYGLPYFERHNTEGLIAMKYGFMYYGVAGCDVSEELEDNVKKENEPIFALLEKKYGTDFWKRLRAEVEEEYQTEKKWKSCSGRSLT